MPHRLNLMLLICMVLFASLRVPAVDAAAAADPPAALPVPADYRTWVYLTSGLDMTYTQPGSAPLPENHVSVFDNVFVNPTAYRVFAQTGIWPDETTFVLENRAGERNISINKAGRTQGAAVSGIELHTKRNGTWAFYARGADDREHLIARPASCYTCHEAHAAVDTTFIQFYPTLLPIAQAKHVLSPRYVEESTADASK